MDTGKRRSQHTDTFVFEMLDGPNASSLKRQP
ncbi:hypothetical protein OKW11_000783 [Pseudomonas baetica]|nr:hypothetical protein [Pseudomonas baetica]